MGRLWIQPFGQYRGLGMRCAPGTHEAAQALLDRHGIRPGSALDLAAGSGAFVLRLKDLGVAHVEAVERDVDNFKADGIAVRPLDLNEPFAAKFDRRFDLVSAIEIIEHLDSPRQFLREARQLLADDGRLLLSTPNVGNWRGRLKFLRSGDLRGFDEANYRFQRHISPLTLTQLRALLTECGLRVIASTTAGDFAGPLRRALTLPLSMVFRLLCGAGVVGEERLFLAARA